MLMRPKIDASQSEIIQYTNSWVKCASAFGISSALKLINKRKKNSLDEIMIAAIIQEYFGRKTKYTITDPDKFPELRMDAIEYEDRSGFSAYHDLAINGVATDLTALFDFRKSDSGHYFVFLEDIHVL